MLSRTALGALALSLLTQFCLVDANPGSRLAASPGYSGRDDCPSRCSDVGPSPARWPAYHNFGQIDSCEQVMFYDFNLHDQVDDEHSYHRIRACASFSTDWAATSSPPKQKALVQSTVKATYQVGWWPEAGAFNAAGVKVLIDQLQQYLSHGHASTNSTSYLFGQSGQATVGLYVGRGLQNEGLVTALDLLQQDILTLNLNSTSVALQLCGRGYDSDHILGIYASSNGTFAPIQSALKSWGQAKCLEFGDSNNHTSHALFTTPLLSAIKAKNNATDHPSNSTTAHLTARGDCRPMQVKAGDDCGSLARECGISGDAFTHFNSDPSLCSTLMPGQHVCCTSGSLPDFKPKPNADGSCATVTINTGDSCSSIAAAKSLTNDDLESFNKNTWGWNGCQNVWAGTIACVSTGSPPMPAALDNAVCGPQVPGTQKPTDGTKFADLNPCPLNACCDVWGQCGITDEFCTDTGLGAPGTAKPGTNGCVSNCGREIVKGEVSEFRSLGYFQGYNFGRECLYQDARQIDTTKFTHLHFAFATLTADYQVEIGDAMTKYQFDNFRRLRGPKRIVSFGGWDFSTLPATYTIFRQGVTAGNRDTLASNLAKFVDDNDLDGVDIDWEYPGAPDIPGIPAGDKQDGMHYLAFLSILKSKLGGKSLSIAAPASYWYLKGFPIAKISEVVDYIVFMTYDLHGQWDAGNKNSQLGCPTGMCLRSQVNITETNDALIMITKAGVPSGKVVVGVTSYGRSFAMADGSCSGPMCAYTGSAGQSDATPGRCTGVAGYISNAEINEIAANSSRVNKQFVDNDSQSNILIYDNNQWVAYMDDKILNRRTNMYRASSMGGTTNWAIDLQKFEDAPSPAKSWADFKQKQALGIDPYEVGSRNGNWTSLDCSDRAVRDLRNLTPTERWNMLDCGDAWQDAINVWKEYDRPKADGPDDFIKSIANTLHGPEGVSCGSLLGSNNCEQTLQCNGFEGSGSGPAAYLIWNSLVLVHEMYSTYHTALYQAAASTIDNALDDMEKQFAPVPPPPDNTWIYLMIDFLSFGTLMMAQPFFNTILKPLPYFAANKVVTDNIKDVTQTTLAMTFNTAKTLKVQSSNKASIGKWSASDQSAFGNYMGQTITAMGNISEVALQTLFNGDDDSIDQLTKIISDGKFVEGSGYTLPSANEVQKDLTSTQLQQSIAKDFFAYAIPEIWSLSDNIAFVIDSGSDCGTIDPLTGFMSKDTMHQTAGCVDGKLYYLASPKGDPTVCSGVSLPGSSPDCGQANFSAPPGLSALDGSAFGGLVLQDIIQGSVRTYKQNGNSNGGNIPNPADSGTWNDMYNQDVTTPGYVRLPVCSALVAIQGWYYSHKNGASIHAPGYPCAIPPGKDDCGDSSFENQSSDGSPLIDDCKAIIKNIQGTDGEWEVENAIGNQHQLVQAGTCAFGIQGIGKNGNIDFHVGAQDIIDVINTSIEKFGANGKVGAKGNMNCKGTVKDQWTEWGLYKND